MTADAFAQVRQHLDAALTCLTDIRTTPTSTLTRDDLEHLTEHLLRLGHTLDATVLHTLRRLQGHAHPHDIVDFLATAPRNLTRTQAKKYVQAAKLTDPDTPFNGAIGGLHGDRGALHRVGAKLLTGDTSLDHVLLTANAWTSMPTTVRRGDLTMQVRRDTGELLDTVKPTADLLDAFLADQVCTTTPGTLKQLTEEMLTLMDPDRTDRGLDPDTTARRRLQHSFVNGMHRVTIDFDDLAYATSSQALNAAATPVPAHDDHDGPDDHDGSDRSAEPDPRTRGEREHDALIDLITAGANATSPLVQQKSTLVVHATVEQLHDQPDAGSPTLDGRGPLTRRQFEHTTCDADIVTVTCDHAGKPLSMTSTARSATPTQRLGLAARDGGCTAPGCGAPAWMSHAHHVRFWSHGGRTDLDNLVLLCGRHHRQLHAGRLEVRFAEDGLPQARWIRHGLPREWVRNQIPAQLARARQLARQLTDDPDPPPNWLT